jgi:hypothetical protein
MNPLTLRMFDLKCRADALAADFENLFALESAIDIAFKERTGRELQPDEEFTREDADRAEEIVRLFPK